MKDYAIVFLISIASVSFASWQQIGNDINGEAAGDYSGRSVALSAGGAIVAIGADANDGNGISAGHARVYNLVFGQGVTIADSPWVQLGSDINGEAAGDGFGSRLDISSDGTIVACSAPKGTNGNGEPSGYVGVYLHDSIANVWTQLGSDIDGENAPWNNTVDLGERFGESLAISADGTRVVIGAPWNNNYTGDARVYEYDGADWIQLGSDIVGEAAGDSNGMSVDISADGSIVVIGATGNDGNGISAGHARVYQYDPTTADWIQLGSDIDGEAERDFSGLRVSISADGPPLGTIVAIGATGNDGNGNSAGHVRVYQYDPTTADWVQRGADIDGEAEGDLFGTSVHLNNGGTIVAIGAQGNDGNGDYAGHVRVMHTLPDSDGDGLFDYDELYAYGTATNNIDTDGDGWSDYFEVNRSYTFSATNNDSAIISSNSAVSSELEAAALLLTTNQAYAMLDDAYTDDIVMSVSNDIADIVMTLEQSTNLSVGAWTTNKFLTNSIPVDADAKFFRFRLAE